MNESVNSKKVKIGVFGGARGSVMVHQLLNHPDAFQYYFAMSAPTTTDIDLDMFANPVLKQKNICWRTLQHSGSVQNSSGNAGTDPGRRKYGFC